jgi:hypothetical protein
MRWRSGKKEPFGLDERVARVARGELALELRGELGVDELAELDRLVELVRQ